MIPLLSVFDAEIAVPRGPTLFSSGALELLPGRFVCLLGPNGSGKSTLLRTLTGLIPPRSGRVILGGARLESVPIDLRGRHLSAVFAASPLSPIVTVYDLVALGRYPFTGRRGRLSPVDRTIVEEELSLLELGGLRHRRIGQLSDGERRRAHLARGLAQRAPVLVLDEALAFLDARWKLRLLSELKRRCLEGMAVILATQDITEALETADTLWLIDRSEGTLRRGGPEDMALQGLVARAFSIDPEPWKTGAAPRFLYEVAGDEGEAVVWTRRGLSRIGGREASDPASVSRRGGRTAVPIVVVSVTRNRGGQAASGYEWRYEVRRPGSGIEFSGAVGSISELVEAVRDLRSDR